MSNSAPKSEEKPPKSNWRFIQWALLGALMGGICLFIYIILSPLLPPFASFIGWYFLVLLVVFIKLGRMADGFIASRLRSGKGAETDHLEKLDESGKNFFKRLFPRKIRIGLGRILFLAVYAYIFSEISLSVFVHLQMWTTPKTSFDAERGADTFYYLEQLQVGNTTYHLVGYPTWFVTMNAWDDFTHGRGGIISNLPVILSVYECHFGGLWCGITYISQQTLSFNGTNICIPCVVDLTYDENTGQVSLRSLAGHKEFVPDGQ